jgi:UDP-N-acetylmuramoyl-tripeptide--D-alanyl-D-alanine ligase
VAVAYGLPPPLVFTLRRVSDGMAQNAVLAICAALWLGVPHARIQSRLSGWQPAALRGEIRREGNRLLYLDCYNANPASMADALSAFQAIAPAGSRGCTCSVAWRNSGRTARPTTICSAVRWGCGPATASS